MLLDGITAEQRLNSPDNLANRFGSGASPVVGPETILPFRPKGVNADRRLPVEIRDTITTLARAGENQPALAREFGVSQPDVSYLKNNRKSENVDKALGTVRDAALDRLMGSLGLLNNDKLAECTAPQLAVVATSMSKIVNDTLPKNQEQSNQTNLIIYAPQIKEERHYEVHKI